MSIENKIRYRNWLRKSYRWDNLRLKMLIRFDSTCQGCGEKDYRNDIHHIFYPATWDETNRSHVKVLCRKCHKRIHELTTPGKYTRKQGRRAYNKAIWILREESGFKPQCALIHELTQRFGHRPMLGYKNGKVIFGEFPITRGITR